MADVKFFGGPAAQPVRPYVPGQNSDSEIVPSPVVVQAQHHLTHATIFRVVETPPEDQHEQEHMR